MTQLELTAERHPIVAGMNPNGVQGLLDAIQRMAPLIEDRRAEFDKLRRLPDEVFEAMADAGLFRLWLPRALGGPELSPFEFMRIVEAASALDGSVGWLVGNGGGMSRAGGYVPKAVAGEWFASPRLRCRSHGCCRRGQACRRRLSHQRALALRQRSASCIAVHGTGGGRTEWAATLLLRRAQRRDDPGQLACVRTAWHRQL
jgi:alkylation response protein AidB-like acyl-CoA dehydrogenase